MTGPTHEPDPAGVEIVRVESAREMLEACRAALPSDVAVFAAAVSDWRPRAPPGADQEIVRRPRPDRPGREPGRARHHRRFGQRATGAGRRLRRGDEDIVGNARKKLRSKGCDWILANDVSPRSGTFGGDENTVRVVSADGVEDWPRLSKGAVAERLAARIAEWFDARAEAAE